MTSSNERFDGSSPKADVGESQEPAAPHPAEGTAPDTATDPGTRAGNDPATDPGTQSGTEAGAQAGTDPWTEAGADPWTDPWTDPGTDTGTGVGTETETGSEAMLGDTPVELVADIAKAQQDVVDLTADLQRLQAEYVNYKRRVDRDRELVKRNAVFQLLAGLLPVLDDIDRAREHGEVEGGFKAVADSLERIVANLGLVRYGEPGDPFDPNLHEALMHAHSPDVTTTTCQNIVQAGYRIGDRVVRAARVTVVDPEPVGD